MDVADLRRTDLHSPISPKGFDTTKDFVEGELSLAQRRYNEILSERDLRVSPEKHKKLLRLFHDLPVWDAMWFLRHKIIKNPLGLWMIQQVMYDVRPDFVVETGTFQGGSALYWAHILDGLGLEDAKVLTVDIQDINQGAAMEGVRRILPRQLNRSEDRPPNPRAPPRQEGPGNAGFGAHQKTCAR